MLFPIISTDDGDQESADRSPMAAASGFALAVPVCSEPPSASELDEFESSRSELRAHIAAELGLTLLAASASGRRMVVVQDFYRGARCTAPDGTNVLYGASARLVVDIAGFDAKAKLTLPAIAAQVEVGLASARYKLTARGYVGPLSEVLIDPGELNVENYVKLMASITKLQKLLADDVEHIRPVPLLVDLPTSDVSNDEHRWAIGVTYALSHIADGESLNKAKQKFDWDAWTPAAQEAINDTYRALVGEEPDLRPDGAVQAAARSQLGALRLK